MTNTNIKKINQVELANVEANMNLDEKLAMYLDEYQTFGALREHRLVDAEAFLPPSQIFIKYDEGKVRFSSLPAFTNFVALYFCENGIRLLLNSDVQDQIWHDQVKITINNPNIDQEYDLMKMSGLSAERLGISGTGVKCLCNNETTRNYFQETCGSSIEVFVLRKGVFQIVFKNMTCDKITFRPSVFFENAFDLVIDSEESGTGEVTFSDVFDGARIKYPALAAALKQQAFLVPLDINRGIFLYKAVFTYHPEFGDKVFVDQNRYSEESNHQFNRHLLEVLKA